MTLHDLQIPTATTVLEGRLTMPADATGLVILAHDFCEGLHGEDVHTLVSALARRGYASLKVELGAGFSASGQHELARRDALHMLSQRLLATTRWMRRLRATAAYPIAYFGVGLSAGAALSAAVASSRDVSCVVTWQGHLDLVGRDLMALLRAPTLMLVDEQDSALCAEARRLEQLFTAEHRVICVARGLTRRQEPSMLEQVAEYAGTWLDAHLSTRSLGLVGAGA